MSHEGLCWASWWPQTQSSISVGLQVLLEEDKAVLPLGNDVAQVQVAVANARRHASGLIRVKRILVVVMLAGGFKMDQEVSWSYGGGSSNYPSG